MNLELPNLECFENKLIANSSVASHYKAMKPKFEAARALIN